MGWYGAYRLIKKGDHAGLREFLGAEELPGRVLYVACREIAREELGEDTPYEEVEHRAKELIERARARMGAMEGAA